MIGLAGLDGLSEGVVDLEGSFFVAALVVTAFGSDGGCLSLFGKPSWESNWKWFEHLIFSRWWNFVRLELTKRHVIDLTDYEVIVQTAFDANEISFEMLLHRGSHPTVTETAVIGLHDKGVNIKGG